MSRQSGGWARRSCACCGTTKRSTADGGAPGHAFPGRARHARIRRLDRARAGLRRPESGRDVDERRHHPDAGGRLPHAAHGLHGRRRHLRLAQSVRGQRHQGVLGRRREVHRDARAAGRGDGRRLVVDAWMVARPARSNRSIYGPSTRPTSARSCRPTRAPPACASPSTAPTARRRRWRRGCSRSSGSTCATSAASRTAGTSTWAAARPRPSSGEAGRRGPVSAWHRLRRRRRPRDLRRRDGQGRGRRRRDADVREADEGRGPAEGRRRSSRR